MIVLDVAQGSEEWIAARLGRPTASAFGRIVTPSGKPSTAVDGYVAELVAEWMLGCQLEPDESAFMERGSTLEADAIRYYEMIRRCRVDRVGFVLRDDLAVGCSPDGLIGEEGGVEIKCLKPAKHVELLLEDIPAKYAAQVQGALWLTGRQWWDWLAYHPSLPPALVRITPDREYIEALEKHMRGFLMRLGVAREQILATGYEPVANPFLPPELRPAPSLVP